MSHEKFLDPVRGDEVPKIDDAVAIGEDLRFQERWWTFEKIIWSVFLIVLLADVLGVFGRGWLSKAKCGGPEAGIRVDFERVLRASTPSIMDIHVDADAVQNGTVKLYVSDTVVKQLGAQRIAPQPERSEIGNKGLTYTFPVNGTPAEVQIALEPSFPGVHTFVLQVPGKALLNERVVVVP